MKVVHVTNYFMPGMGYQENHLPFAQAKLGHEVHIITGDRHAPLARYDELYASRFGPRVMRPGTLREDDVTIHRLSVGFEVRTRQDPWFDGLSRCVASILPDVLHLHGVTPLNTLRLVLSSAARRYPTVVDHHLCRFNLQPWTVQKRLYYGALRNLLFLWASARVDAWLPINEDARTVLAEVLGVRAGVIRINRLGADLSRFRFDAAVRESGRRSLGISPQARVFIHAGRIAPRKDIHVLLAAFAKRGLPGDVLVLAGGIERDYEQKLRSLAGAGPAEVRYLPMQSPEELARLFNVADVAVWPGDGSIALIQAMACGLPQLIGDDPGLAYVANSPDAHVFRRGDPDALAKLIARPWPHLPDRRSRIEDFCRRNFDWRSIASESISIYRAAIAAHKPALRPAAP
jgi:glycosyltransferase involved in cell wall biosynthesis